MTRNVLILGAAGRDFHNFLVFYKNNPNYHVVGFTATQIPGIDNKRFPASLAGGKYPTGIPIYPEKELEDIVRKHHVDECSFAYSDVSHQYVMNKASEVQAAGATFVLLGPQDTMIKSKKPVISVCAVRTGSGKSQTSRSIVEYYLKKGEKIVAIRHPMPYGDLAKQAVQRFEHYDDFEKHDCTIEEREEYERYIEKGMVIFAGVDYQAILEEAEKEADIILWDGGNNDWSFYTPDLNIVVADPHRAGHELSYYPGETNFRMADVLIINKIDSASKEQVEIVEKNARKVNPHVHIIKAKSDLSFSNPELVRGKKVLVVEDGPTTTHGGMPFGAGTVAAKKLGCILVDPRPHAVGSIQKIFEKFPHLKEILPAMGYGTKQVRELEQTINDTPCDAVVSGTPINLKKLLNVNKPIFDVAYELDAESVQKLCAFLAKVR
ncbi:cyclic 2,3-diphosphoglycerate synthase [Candidatus Micrarchaeota archaeon]|nr:cyclic 2,3-diphosphoglycerate synthase [Candidatus Micrarchaeota archaeon]MBU1930629.1 cyclic 2,3-diphosphoglycerate synthase [Candidatus Micrarchaeota archaeon]